MGRKVNKKLIGIFTFSGVALFLAIMLYFIGSKVFIKKDDLVVMFFKESIQGLKVGSPVVFKGVEIGKVVNINLLTDGTISDYNIPVYVSMNNTDTIKNKEELLKNMVQSGLRARLATYSFITGQLMIELVFAPEIEARYLKKFNNIPEMPTILSSKGEISEGLKNIPIKSILDKIDNVLTETNIYLPSILKEVNGILVNVNKFTSVDVDKEIANNLNDAIINFNATMKSIKNLADYLERHPESLLKGKQGDY